MIKYKCSCCGGDINRATMICEYCGTRYKEEYGNVIRVEKFQNPVQTLNSRVVLDDFEMRSSPQEYSERTIRQLASQFADCIAPYMDTQYSFDHITGRPMLYAQIKIVKPSRKESGIPDAIYSYYDRK